MSRQLIISPYSPSTSSILKSSVSKHSTNSVKEVEFIKTQVRALKGPGSLLAHDGFLYWHSKGDIDKVSWWKCVLSKNINMGTLSHILLFNIY